MGKEASEEEFSPLEARAEDVIGAMTRWQAMEAFFASLSPFQQTLVKKAICAQVDFFAVNGLDSVNDVDNGFTVGKVHVNGISGTAGMRGLGMMDHVSPMAKMYLEQSGLMNPSVPAWEGRVC
jgi:hypothetical protein